MYTHTSTVHSNGIFVFFMVRLQYAWNLKNSSVPPPPQKIADPSYKSSVLLLTYPAIIVCTYLKEAIAITIVLHHCMSIFAMPESGGISVFEQLPGNEKVAQADGELLTQSNIVLFSLWVNDILGKHQDP